jgi:hypothetical protein
MDLIWQSKDYLQNESNISTTHVDLHIKNRGGRFLLNVSQHGTCWVPEWIEPGKGKRNKKSKTTLACSCLFETRVYDK